MTNFPDDLFNMLSVTVNEKHAAETKRIYVECAEWFKSKCVTGCHYCGCLFLADRFLFSTRGNMFRVLGSKTWVKMTKEKMYEKILSGRFDTHSQGEE